MSILQSMDIAIRESHDSDIATMMDNNVNIN